VCVVRGAGIRCLVVHHPIETMVFSREGRSDGRSTENQSDSEFLSDIVRNDVRL
jgi:hypothetical protein